MKLFLIGFVVAVLVIVGVVLTVVKPSIIFTLSPMPALPGGDSLQRTSIPPLPPSVLSPESGTTITIRNCKGDPEILQVAEGTEVTFTNADDQTHTIGVADAAGIQNLQLPAKGSATLTATFRGGRNFTSNYICDDRGWPDSGGAIYVEP